MDEVIGAIISKDLVLRNQQPGSGHHDHQQGHQYHQQGRDLDRQTRVLVSCIETDDRCNI